MPGRMTTVRSLSSAPASRTTRSCCGRHAEKGVGASGASSAAGVGVAPSTHTPEVYTKNRGGPPDARGRLASINVSIAWRSTCGRRADESSAVCTMPSHASAADVYEAGFERSPITGWTPRCDTRSALSGSRTSAVTWCPARSTASSTAPPTYPVAPVRKIRILESGYSIRSVSRLSLVVERVFWQGPTFCRHSGDDPKQNRPAVARGLLPEARLDVPDPLAVEKCNHAVRAHLQNGTVAARRERRGRASAFDDAFMLEVGGRRMAQDRPGSEQPAVSIGHGCAVNRSQRGKDGGIEVHDRAPRDELQQIAPRRAIAGVDIRYVAAEAIGWCEQVRDGLRRIAHDDEQRALARICQIERRLKQTQRERRIPDRLDPTVVLRFELEEMPARAAERQQL